MEFRALASQGKHRRRKRRIALAQQQQPVAHGRAKPNSELRFDLDRQQLFRHHLHGQALRFGDDRNRRTGLSRCVPIIEPPRRRAAARWTTGANAAISPRRSSGWIMAWRVFHNGPSVANRPSPMTIPGA